MKPKVTRGRGFRGVLDYAFDEGAKATGDKSAELVGGTMSGTDPRMLAAEFGHTRRLRKDVTRPVWHCSLALPADDRLSSQRWEDVAADFMQRMGFPPDTQWIAVRHQDTDYDHIHIIASRVSLSGQVWYGQHEALNAITAAQELEREHGLTITQGLYGEAKPIASLTQGEVEMSLASGQEPPKQALQRLVAAAAAGKLTVVEFADRLAAVGVCVLPNLASTGRLAGFSFEYQGVAFKGSKLGKAYGWPSLQKMGVTYVEDRDRAQLERLKTKVERDTASDGLASATRDAVEASATATAAARRATGAVAGSSDDVRRIQQLGATVDRIVAGARSAESEERHQRLRATTERALAAATAATANLKQLEHDSGRAVTALQRSVFGYHRTRQTAAKLGECFDVGAGQLGVIGRRAAVQRGQQRRNASDEIAPSANRRSVAAVGDQCDRIAALGKRIARAAEALSAVRLLVQAPEPECRLPEPATMTDDALDAALAAAVNKAQQQHQVGQDIPRRPVIESNDLDYDNDPLAQPASPPQQQRGPVLFNVTSGEPYQEPNADQLAEWQRALDSRPEPTDDELVDLVPEGVPKALELLDEQQDEDGIDFDELDDGPSGPSFG